MTLPTSGNPISFSQVDVELGFSSTAQISMNDTVVRTLFGVASGAIAMSSGLGKSNTSVPGAPTGVSASATSCSAISVSFSAPACTGHLSIDYYQVVCTSSGSNSATGASSPISVTGLSPTTSYTFKVRAHNSKGYGCYSSSTGTATTNAARGSVSFTTPGCYSWSAPAGVSKISLFAVGGGGGGRGGGGGGGSSSWRNNWPVTSGSYTIRVGAGGAACACNGYNPNCTFITAPSIGNFVLNSGPGYNGSRYSGGSSGAPNAGVASNRCGSSLHGNYGGYGYGGTGGGGGGYGPYSGCSIGYGGSLGTQGGGGYGYVANYSSSCYSNGSGGAGGGGGSYAYCYPYSVCGPVYICLPSQKRLGAGGGGGGVGLCGQGGNGSRGCYYSISGQVSTAGTGGAGGSGGSAGGTGVINWASSGYGGTPGSYGGGSGGGGFIFSYVGYRAFCNCYGAAYFYWQNNGYVAFGSVSGNTGAGGAVVILWPGNSRSYPSTDVSR
jgi:hypothetical protein